MSAPFDTLYLNPGSWDLLVDASGNIALASPPYALAQDVASVCRTFLGEVYYDASLGIPYLQKILGKTPALNVVQGALVAAALTVPTVDAATCVISSFKNRQAVGQIQFETTTGASGSVSVGQPESGSPLLSESGQELLNEGGPAILVG